MKIITAMLATLLLWTVPGISQSKKEIKKHGIRASTVIEVEDGKTLTNRKCIYGKNGETLEETTYTKEGTFKTLHKYKYNGDGDQVEEEEYDENNKLTERKKVKYN